MDKIIFIITTDKYPEGDAGAVREHAFCCILRDLGYTPIVFGLGSSTGFSVKEYDGVKYYSFRYTKNDNLSKAKAHLLYLYHLRKVIKEYKTSDVKGILFVSGRESTLNYVKKYCLKHSIQMYHDSVEWYSPSEFAKGEKAKGYIKNNELNTRWIDRDFKVFAISSFLEKHFKSRGIETLRVPVIMDMERIGFNKNTNSEYIKIIYAGQMGTKDKIVNFIKALSLMSKAELNRLRIVLIGITKEQFENKFGKVANQTNGCVTFTGRVSRTEVLKHLETADFTMLLRPVNERYAMAGFPTKVVESLSSATPVICNYTSDLKMYLNDGENAIIVDGTSVESCAYALRKALNLSNEERQKMQFNARATAEKEFDYRVYTEELRRFML